MGQIEINHTGSGGTVVLSSDGTDLLLGGSAVGGSPDLFAENPSSATTPSATGTNAVAIGSGSVASGQKTFAIGTDTDATGSYSFAIGQGAQATANYNLAIGLNAVSSGERAVAIGNNSVTASGSWSTAIGNNSSNGGSKAVAIGAMALGGSYASGANSFAAAIANNTSSYGATAANSIAIGYQSKASSGYGVAIGRSCQAGDTGFATGSSALATGAKAFSHGLNTTASASYSKASGREALSNIEGKSARASGKFSAQGDAQGGQFILRSDTTNATAEAMTTNNSTAAATNQVVAASDTCIMFSGTIVAMQNGAADQGGWEIKGLLKNDGGTTTLVNSEVRTFADGNGWSIVLSADNTNNALKVQCTGEASHNIRWVANIQTSEVTYA